MRKAGRGRLQQESLCCPQDERALDLASACLAADTPSRRARVHSSARWLQNLVHLARCELSMSEHARVPLNRYACHSRAAPGRHRATCARRAQLDLSRMQTVRVLPPLRLRLADAAILQGSLQALHARALQLLLSTAGL